MARVIVGAICLALGALWILQGIGTAKGSFMTGHGQWTAIGTVLVVVGAGLVASRIVGNRRR